jgi:hypothetical protein
MIEIRKIENSDEPLTHTLFIDGIAMNASVS